MPHVKVNARVLNKKETNLIHLDDSQRGFLCRKYKIIPLETEK